MKAYGPFGLSISLWIKLLIVIVLGLALDIYLWGYSEFPYDFFGREPLTNEQIQEAVPEGYLPKFYEHVEDIDFYFIEEDAFPQWLRNRLIANSRCRFSPPGAPWKSPDVYIIKRPTEEPGFCCFTHEIGHYIDYRNGEVSDSKEFREAVELTIQMYGETSLVSLCSGIEQPIYRFPGINGNELLGGIWGGYSELYARLFELRQITNIPSPLRPFYEDYLP